MNIDENIKFLKTYGISITKEKYNENAHKRVIVGMSGGVDSSACAAELLGV